MSGELILGSRLEGAMKRTKLEQVDLKCTVADLRSRITQTLGVKESDYDVIYAGRRLTGENTLDTYGIKSGVTLHIIKRQMVIEPDKPEPFDKSSVPMLLTALQAALLNPAHRHLVTKILTNRETLENIIAATPGLHSDVTAQALLQTPELLINLANPDDAEQILERHPSLVHAAMMVAAVVNEEAAKGGVKPGHSAGTYSLDQMSDDEDYEEPAQRPITTNQLAAALAAASGQPVPSASGTSSSGSGQRIITDDFFRQAMQQAMGSVGAGSSGSGTGSSDVTTPSESMMESQLQQLREMGITDDAAARQALQVAGGNVQMALSILFGDMNEMI